MKRPLSRAFDPPAPILPVRVRTPGGTNAASLDGKIDTAADLCAVPERHLAELEIPPVRTIRAAGFLGGIQEVIVYRADIALGDTEFMQVDALATRRPYVIVGRNVLRHFVVRMDGPLETIEVRLPRRR